MTSSRQTMPRQNYHEESEAGVNRHINLEAYASYVFQSMAYYCDRDDVAMPGFHKFFQDASVKNHENVEKLMKFQNRRGGRIVLQDVKRPERDEWGTGLEVMQVALQVEKNINQSLLDLHAVADTHNDIEFADWLESNFLTKQTEAIKELSDHVANLKRVGPGLGEYMFDKTLLSH